MTPGEPCPCCGHRTLLERDYYELCPVCFWEDDPEQAERPWAWGGANGISLVEGQQAYLRDGAVHSEAVSKVRPPRPDEARDQNWQPYDPAEGELHPLYTEEEEREFEARGREHAAAFRSGLNALRGDTGRLSDAEIQRRVRELSDTLRLHYGAAEVELVSHLVRDDQWPRRHRLQAFAWAWRHRRSTSLPARLSQLNFHPFAEDAEPRADDAMAAFDSEAAFEEYNAAVLALSAEASTLGHREIKKRLRALVQQHQLPLADAELELFSRRLRDEHWYRRHPVRAGWWLLRYSRPRTFARRLQELRTGSIHFIG